MDINSLINSAYIQILVVALLVVGFNVIIFLEKAKKKLTTYEKSILKDLSTDYQNKQVNVGGVIEIYNVLIKKDEKVNSVKTYINGNLWAGIVFLISCLVGFALDQMSISSSIPIILISTSGFFFFIYLIYLIYWYVKN